MSRSSLIKNRTIIWYGENRDNSVFFSAEYADNLYISLIKRQRDILYIIIYNIFGGNLKNTSLFFPTQNKNIL